MGRSTVTMTVIYVLFVICVLVCHSLEGVVTEEDTDNTNDRDHMLTGLELFLQRKTYDLLKENPSLLKYVISSDPELNEFQNRKFKRGPAMAGLENFDFMTGIFSKLPMRTSAAISDMRQRMRAAGR